MLRTVLRLAALLSGIFLVSAAGTAQDSVLKPGDKFEGELRQRRLDKQTGGFATELPIALTAKQGISLTATVAGDDRKIMLALEDPSGKIIAMSKRTVKSAQLMIDEVNATGKYKVLVISDKVGAFTLRVNGPVEEELDEKALEAKIKRLKQELAESEAKLKALKEKSK